MASDHKSMIDHVCVVVMMIGLTWWMMPGAVVSEAKEEITIVITNNHTNYLSVRCFSFNDDFTAQHLKPNQTYTFRFFPRVIFPSATMFNCSTNMGAFIAYRYDYECRADRKCIWMFDENKTYLYVSKYEKWKPIDYNPNYESLIRGGVVKGYYSN